MAIREIITGEDEILRKKCRAVDKFDDRLGTLLDDLTETLYKAGGAGLAAIQVGILRRAVVIDVGESLIELVNPEIIEQDGEQTDNEGCLSFPNMYGEVARPQRVKVRAQRRDGSFFEVEGEGLLARALCHELDHLNGILFIDFVDELYEME